MNRALFLTITMALCLPSAVAAQSSPAAPPPEVAPSVPGEKESKNPNALYALGQKYLRGEGVSQDYEKAFPLLQEAADLNHADAMAALGYLYSVGLGVPKDDAKARSFFARGSENGSLAARVNLGIFLVKGRGGNKDVEGGIALLKEAAEKGDTQAASRLGEIFYFGEHADGRSDYQKAHDVLIGEAEAGNAVAQNMIGVILKNGYLGPKDKDSARVWFERAALQGNAKACANLADIWDHQSPDRSARIEAIRWLVVSRNLKEITGTYKLEDIQATLAPDEFKVAERLADVTMANLSKKE